MLVNLTPDPIETARRFEVAEEHDFEFVSQSDPKWLQETGIYQSSFPFNFPKEEFLEKLCEYDEYNESKLKSGQTMLQLYSKGKYLEMYGVADNVEQIKEFYAKQVKSKKEKFAISLTPVWQEKENKGKGGGWRWHKWGQYIGKLNPQFEHLDDEDFGDDFECILVFHIYFIK